jgi:hypothetical protein
MGRASSSPPPALGRPEPGRAPGSGRLAVLSIVTNYRPVLRPGAAGLAGPAHCLLFLDRAPVLTSCCVLRSSNGTTRRHWPAGGCSGPGCWPRPDCRAWRTPSGPLLRSVVALPGVIFSPRKRDFFHLEISTPTYSAPVSTAFFSADLCSGATVVSL